MATSKPRPTTASAVSANGRPTRARQRAVGCLSSSLRRLRHFASDLCPVGPSWGTRAGDRPALSSQMLSSSEHEKRASGNIMFGSEVGEVPTEQNQQKMQGMTMRCRSWAHGGLWSAHGISCSLIWHLMAIAHSQSPAASRGGAASPTATGAPPFSSELPG